MIYLLKCCKIGPITCIVCHANWLISGFKIRSTFINKCHIQSIFRSVVLILNNYPNAICNFAIKWEYYFNPKRMKYKGHSDGPLFLLYVNDI